LTGGYMTLAATLCTDKVSQGIAADGSGVLMHGPTFMANPLACRVACESLDILLTSNWQQQVNNIEQQLIRELSAYQRYDLVKDVRVKGAIGVIELHKPLDPEMTWLSKFIVDQGVWLRPFRNLIYIMPPYIISSDELSYLSLAMGKILDKIVTSKLQ